MPRSKQSYFEEIVTNLSQDSDELPGNNQITIDSFSEGPPPDPEFGLFWQIAVMRWETSYEAFASRLANLARWSGRTVTEDDLPDLAETFPSEVNPDHFDIEEYNKHVNRSDLDEWADGQGVDRVPARRATGDLLVFVRSDTDTLPAGSVFTAIDENGRRLDYETLADRTPESGAAQISDVSVRAVAGGPAYNVGPGVVSESPQVADGVTNPGPISGGEVAETQAELRTRGRRSLELNADGDTEQGIVGELISQFGANGLELDDVLPIPHQDPEADDNEYGYQYMEVVVDGGATDDAIQAVLDDWDYPSPFYLSRPIRHPINITGTLVPRGNAAPEDINTDRARKFVLRWLSEFAIGEEFSTSQLNYQIHRSDPDDIVDIDALDVIDQYTGETVPPGTDLDTEINARDKIVAGNISFTAGGG